MPLLSGRTRTRTDVDRHDCCVEYADPDRGVGVTPPTSAPPPRWLVGVVTGLVTYLAAFWLRLREWSSWQDVEFRLGSEMLLATHDAYHWIAGAEGFEFGAGHPMSELLRLLALLTGTDPASAGFWLPPVVASLVAVLVFAWAWSMGSMEAGFCAGILASLAPGFLARTLLGYADTDLVTLFLPLLIGLIPGWWVMRFLRHPFALLPGVSVPSSGRCPNSIWSGSWLTPAFVPKGKGTEMFSPVCVLLLGTSGFLSWWAQEWHSMFPYLVRFNAILLGSMAFFLARPGQRPSALLASLAHVLPSLTGPAGVLLPLALLVASVGGVLRFVVWLRRPPVLCVFWTLACVLLFDGDVLATMLRQVQAYLKPVGDTVFSTSGTAPLIFPSVAQSIIEIQDLTLSEMRLYFHPWPAVAVIGLIGFILLVCVRSGALFLLPLAGLALLSTKMGGRMVMFGAPVVALGLALPLDWLACTLGDTRIRRPLRLGLGMAALAVAGGLLVPEYGAEVREFWEELGELCFVWTACLGLLWLIIHGREREWQAVIRMDAIGPHFLYRLAVAMLVLISIAPPLAELIPAMTQGPIINRRHADALRAVRAATPPDAMIWLWWDWGYAAHHFSRRSTIADGAEHGGASLFLPAAVFATDDPRYARQIIKYTATKDNVPGQVFANMTAVQAARLMERLKSPEIPLISAPGKQYLIVSFDMLDLGFWISTFGNWNFLEQEGRGYAISIVPQALSYRLDRGEVVMKGTSVMVPAASIDVFADGRLEHRDYVTAPEFLPDTSSILSWREDVERRRNVHFLFNRVTGEKLVVDDRMYNTLMVQLLIGKPGDPRFLPYFQLIYDNIFCRVYEVL